MAASSLSAIAQIAIPLCEKGLGKIISNAESPDFIDGVRVQPYSLYPDDRGYFLEVARAGQDLVARYPQSTTQVSAALSYPGTIKAFHYHSRQTDCWIPVAGMLQIALVDLRPESKTFGVRNTLYVGELRTWRLLVPPGVGHGYKVIGAAPAVLVYLTDRFYDPSDEGRIAYNDPSINYDWETQHR